MWLPRGKALGMRTPNHTMGIRICVVAWVETRHALSLPMPCLYPRNEKPRCKRINYRGLDLLLQQNRGTNICH